MELSIDQLHPGSMRRLQPCDQNVPIAGTRTNAATDGQHPFAQVCNDGLADFHRRRSSAIRSTARKAGVYRMVMDLTEIRRAL